MAKRTERIKRDLNRIKSRISGLEEDNRKLRIRIANLEVESLQLEGLLSGMGAESVEDAISKFEEQKVNRGKAEHKLGQVEDRIDHAIMMIVKYHILGINSAVESLGKAKGIINESRPTS